MWPYFKAGAAGLVLVVLAVAGCDESYFGGTTPSNDSAVVYVGAPAFYPYAGTYTEPVDVQILCATNDAVIYYTTDGTPPSATIGTPYARRIHLEASATLRAIATVKGMVDSPVTSATYTLDLAATHVNVPPTLSGLSIVATLHDRAQATFVVSCQAKDSDGKISSVTADLSSVGGPANQALAMDIQNSWIWSGPVFPTSAGTRTITVTATDSSNATASASQDILVLPALNDGAQQWKAILGAATESSPAIGQDGTIYIGSQDRFLYAINPDGTNKWRFETRGPIYSSPATGPDGVIYVGSADTNLYAVNPDGTERWHFGTGFAVHGSPAIDKDGTVYVGSWDSKLYAILANGSLKWTIAADQPLYSSPAIWYGRHTADMTVYVGCQDGYLYAVKADGSLRWKLSLGGQIDSSPALAPDGSIYVGSTGGMVYSVNANGTLKWQVATAAAVRSSPAVAPDGTIYVGSDDKLVYAISPAGATKWTFKTGDSVSSSPAIAADGTICVGSADGTVYAIAPTGQLRWRYVAGSPIVSSPAIGADGTVYVGLGDRSLGAIRGSAGVAGGNWPMFHGNLQHTGLSSVPAAVNAPPELNAPMGVRFFVQGAQPRTPLPSLPRESMAVDLQPFCQVSDPDGDAIQSVLADLSQIGGSAAQPLASTDPAHLSWDAFVSNIRPPTGGDQAVVFTATDARGAVGMLTQFTHIDPNAPPTILAFSMVPAVLPQFQAIDVTLTCTATDDVQVASVTADLSPLSGQRFTTLTAAGNNQYTWSGQVTASVIGTGRITATARDDRNQAMTADLVFLVYDPSSGGTPGTLKWKFDTTRWVDSTPAIDTGGTIYFGCDDHKLYALNPDKSQKWAFSTNGNIESSPAVGINGTIFFGSRDHNVYAVDPATGKEVWHYATGGEIVSSPAIYAVGAASETLYIGSNDGSLYALNASNGQLKWKTAPTGGAVRSSPAVNVAGTTVYVGSDDRCIYAFNTADGKERYTKYQTGGAVFATPVLTTFGPTNVVCVGSGDRNMYVLTTDLKLQWKYLTGGSVYSSVALTTSDPQNTKTLLCFGSDDGSVYGVDSFGALKWKSVTGGPVRSSPCVGSDKTVYVGSYDGLLYAIDPSDGKQIWTYDAKGSILSSPVIGAGAVIYVGSRGRLVSRLEESWPILSDRYLSDSNGGLFAIYGAGGSRAPWLMFRHDAQRRG